MAESGGYEHVKVVKKFSPPDQDLLQYVHDGIIPGRNCTTVISSVNLRRLNRAKISTTQYVEAHILRVI